MRIEGKKKIEIKKGVAVVEVKVAVAVRVAHLVLLPPPQTKKQQKQIDLLTSKNKTLLVIGKYNPTSSVFFHHTILHLLLAPTFPRLNLDIKLLVQGIKSLIG